MKSLVDYVLRRDSQGVEPWGSPEAGETLERVWQQIDADLDAHIAAIQAYLRQPSVSGTGEGIEQGAAATADLLERVGGAADIVPTPGHPAVLGSLDGAGPRLLRYFMYDVQPAAHFADRIAVMYLGRIVEEGPARAVVRDPQHPYTRALMSVVPKRDPRARSEPQVLTGETPDPVAIPSGLSVPPEVPGRRRKLSDDRSRFACPGGSRRRRSRSCMHPRVTPCRPIAGS